MPVPAVVSCENPLAISNFSNGSTTEDWLDTKLLSSQTRLLQSNHDLASLGFIHDMFDDFILMSFRPLQLYVDIAGAHPLIEKILQSCFSNF